MMNEAYVFVHVTFDQERKEEFVVLLEHLVLKIREEQGNKYFVVTQVKNTENRFVLCGCWENEEAMQTHMDSEIFAKVIPQIGNFFIEFSTQEAMRYF